MKKFIYTYLFVCSFATHLVSNNRNVDSLIVLLKSASADTSKANYYNLISIEYWKTGDYANGLLFADSALQKATALNFKTALASAHDNIGTINWYQGNYPIALNNYLSALKIRDYLNNESFKAVSYNNIGMVYLYQGNFAEAIVYYNKALQIFQKRYAINNKDVRNLNGLAAAHNNIGNVYYSMGKQDSALQSFFLSLKIRQEIGEKQGIAASYNNIAILYEESGDFAKAILYYQESLKLMTEIGDKESLAGFYLNIGTLYIKQHKLPEARKHIFQSLQLATEMGSKLLFKECYFALASLDSVANNYKQSFVWYKLYVAYRDSLINEENTEKTVRLQMNYAFEKKELASKAEQDKLNVIAAKEKQKQKMMIYAVIGVLLLAMFFAWLIFKRFKITQHQKKIIEEQKVMVDNAYESLHEKNKEVMDSIYYARRIQRALITPEAYIDKTLNKLNKNN